MFNSNIQCLPSHVGFDVLVFLCEIPFSIAAEVLFSMMHNRIGPKGCNFKQ